MLSPVNLTGSEISREHFALFSRRGDVCVQDLSSNGTVVNGKPVAQKRPQKLVEGDVISVPGYEIELGTPLPKLPFQETQHLVTSPHRQKGVYLFGESFTLWEL